MNAHIGISSRYETQPTAKAFKHQLITMPYARSERRKYREEETWTCNLKTACIISSDVALIRGISKRWTWLWSRCRCVSPAVGLEMRWNIGNGMSSIVYPLCRGQTAYWGYYHPMHICHTRPKNVKYERTGNLWSKGFCIWGADGKLLDITSPLKLIPVLFAVICLTNVQSKSVRVLFSQKGARQLKGKPLF